MIYNEGRGLNFKAATGRLITRVTLSEIAGACGALVNSIERARMDPASGAYRSPPAGWELAVAKLARERSGEIQSLAEDLERQHRSQASYSAAGDAGPPMLSQDESLARRPRIPNP
jgi:hypothetical protein